MLIDIVKKIVSEQGEQVLSDPKRVSAFFSDLAKDEPKPKKRVIIECLEHDVVKLLKNVSEEELVKCKESLAQRLHKEEGGDLNLYREAIDILCEVLFGEINLKIKKLPENSHKLLEQIEELNTKLVGKEKELKEKDRQAKKQGMIFIIIILLEVLLFIIIYAKNNSQQKCLHDEVIKLDQKHTDSSFKDPRDGKEYKTVKINDQVWMAENLNYNANGSVCYDNNPENCNKYGKLYNWETAKNVCPDGWHLPTDEEWDKLYRFADGTSGKESPYKSGTAGKYLKAASGWNDNKDIFGNGEDKYGFAALPGGRGYSVDSFEFVGYYGYWWSASEYSASSAYLRYMDYQYGYALAYYGYKSYLRSIRCLKN